MASKALPPLEDKARAVEEMFDRIAPRYDLVNRVMTMGLDLPWRRRAVRDLGLPPGSSVVDLACGTGDFCRILRRGGHRPIGLDFSSAMLAHARERAGAPVARADVLRLPLRDASVDGATCGFALRNVTDIGACFAETARVLRPGGRVAFLDVGEPRGPVARRAHALYFHRVVPVIGRVLSDGDAYRYLPASAAYLPPPGELLEMLRRAGFRDARRTPLGAGAAQLLVGTRG